MKNLVEKIFSFINNPTGKVSNGRDFQDIDDCMSYFPNESGLGDSGVEDAVQFYLENSVKTHHPHFMNQLWSGYSDTGTIAEFMGAAANTSMYTYEVAPVATVVERRSLDGLGRLAGFSSTEGLFVPGASYGNMLGILLARHYWNPKIKSHGQQESLVFYCSQDAHYSMLKAANILGIGQENVIKIPVDSRGRMDTQELNVAIGNSQKQRKTPFAVIATAGTTVRAAFDPIDEIADICEQKNLWLHVDGALGGSLLFSKKGKEILKGLQRADSFVWNLHKMMGLPMHCSVFLCQKSGVLGDASSLSQKDTSYIFHSSEQPDLGPFSFQCGRKADVLKLWLAWVKEGTNGFGQRVDKMLNLASYTEEQIKNHSNLKLICSRESVTVCFQFVQESADDLNNLNKEIRESLLEEGHLAINYGIVNEQVALRIVPFNPVLEKEDIDRILEMIIERGHLLSQ